jgi:dienelactone hydrolase
MAGLRLRPISIVSALALVGVFQVCAANADIQVRLIEYKHGDTVMEGYLAYNDVAYGKRPGVLLGHTWSGVDPFIKERAEAYAKLGYVVFVPDIYGKGVRPEQPPAAAAEMKKYMDDRALLRGRALAGLDILRAQATVDPNKLLAAGYCFGGAIVLELARSGAELAGVVTFHGALSSPTPQDAKNIKARVLVLHGADDPLVSPKEVEAFQKEMRDASKERKDKKDKELDWQLVAYGNTVHSFTDRGAGNDNSKGAAYNEIADKRSWSAMQIFFKEIVNP